MSTATGMPFILTEKMKQGLRALGISEEDIRHTSPGEAYRILGEAATQRRILLNSVGFSSIPVTGKEPRVLGWQKMINASPETIRSWEENYPDHFNTGLLAGPTPGFDIDILEPAAAAAVEALVREWFKGKGKILVRTGRAPKRLIPFRAGERFRKKQVIFTPTVTADGEVKEGKIELLADGQQYVGFGIHPDTVKPYTWDGGEPGDVKLEELPELSEAEAEALVEAAVDLLVNEHGYVRNAPDHTRAPGDPGAPQDFAKVKAALEVIPSDDENVWFKVCCALVAAERATPGDDDWFELFDAWSQNSGKYDAEEVEAKWEDKSWRGYSYTAASIYWLADQEAPGWRRTYETEKTRAAMAAAAQRRAEQLKLNAQIGEEILEPNLPTIMTLAEMEEKLVWIGGVSAVAHRDTGRVRKKEHAAGEYAASLFLPKKPKAKPIPCLTLWIKSPKRRTVDALAWVPGEPEFCRAPEEMDGHKTAFNTWRGLEPLPAPEDWEARAQPFIDHVAYLVPIESERRRFLQWLAHIGQHPEVLPHTAYLMIAEKQGIGRNLLASILVRVFRGHVAAGISFTELLDDPYNGRMSRKLLYIIDEVREGSGLQRHQREQRLRTVTTQEVRKINPKFGVQSIEKNCCRGLKFSNHWDAIPFDNSDRREQVIANPTTPKAPAYYERLYGALGDRLFIGSVRRFLDTLDLSDFKPGAHAVMNEAKQQAIAVMKTDVESAIEDFKHDCGKDLVSRRDIDDAVHAQHPFGSPPVNSAHVTHAIANAGMTSTGHRVRDKLGHLHAIVIVNTSKWTLSSVKTTSPQALLQIIGYSDEDLEGP